MVSSVVQCECAITLSLYYEKYDDGYKLEVQNAQFLNSISGA